MHCVGYIVYMCLQLGLILNLFRPHLEGFESEFLSSMSSWFSDNIIFGYVITVN